MRGCPGGSQASVLSFHEAQLSPEEPELIVSATHGSISVTGGFPRESGSRAAGHAVGIAAESDGDRGGLFRLSTQPAAGIAGLLECRHRRQRMKGRMVTVISTP